MSVLELIIAFLAPHTCVGCQTEGTLLCNSCLSSMRPPLSSCFYCHKQTRSCRTCNHCRKDSALTSVLVTADYADIAKELVWRLKFTGAISAADTIAGCMAKRHNFDNVPVVVPIPTATRRIRQRGYDQAALMAKSYAKLTGCPYLPCLRRYGQKQQRGASRAERLNQLDGKYEIKPNKPVQGMHVLLIDDVATTGATLEAAANILLAAGAKQVSALVFARA